MEIQEQTSETKSNKALQFFLISVISILSLILIYLVFTLYANRHTKNAQDFPTITLTPSQPISIDTQLYKNTRPFSSEQVKKGTSDIILGVYEGKMGIFYGNDWTRTQIDLEGNEIFNPKLGLFVDQEAKYADDVNLDEITVIHHVISTPELIPSVIYLPAQGREDIFYLLFGYATIDSSMYPTQTLYEVSTDFSQPLNPIWNSGLFDGKKYRDSFRLDYAQIIHPKYIAIYFGICNECDSFDIAGAVIINLDTKAESYLYKAGNISYNNSLGRIEYQTISERRVSCTEDDRYCEVDGTKLVNEPTGDIRTLTPF